MLKKYFRNISILGITEVLLRLKGLVLMPIITKAFGAVNYGIWTQVSVVVSMVAPLIVLSTDSAALRFLPGQSKQDIRRGFTTLLLYYIGGSLLACLLLKGFANPLASLYFESQAYARFVWLSGGVIFTTLLSNLLRNFYRITNNVKMFSMINIAQSLYSTAIAIGVVILKETVFEVVLLGVIADLILAVVLIIHISIRYGLAYPDLNTLIKYIRYGLPLFPAGYAMWALNMVDRLFIIHYGSLNDVGVYNLIYSLGYLLINLIFNPIFLMYPSTAAELYNLGKLEDLSVLYRYSTRLALGLLVPGIIGLSILGIPLVRLVSTEEFVRGGPLIPLITLGYTFLMLAAYYEVILGFVGRQIYVTIIMFIAAAFNLLLNAVLVPAWGIAGAAWATALGFGLQLSLSVWISSKYVHLRFDWECLAKVCLASLGMACAIWIIPIGNVKWSVLVHVMLGAVIYGLLILLLKALTSDEWNTVLEIAHLDILRHNPVIRRLLGINNG